MPFPDYPKALEYDTWERGKSKLTPETGVGKELKALKTSYNAIKKDAFDDMETAKTVDQLETAIRKAEAEFTKSVRPYNKDLLDFVRYADAEVVKAKKSITFPKASRELIDSMSKAASSFAVVVRDAPDDMKKKAEKRLTEREAAVKKFGKIRQEGLDAANTFLETLQELSKKMKDAAKLVETAAGAATTAARDGDNEAAAKAGKEAEKQFGRVEELAEANESTYHRMETNKTINDNRTMKPQQTGLDVSDVAEYGDLWNKTVESIRLQTRISNEMKALFKEVSLDAETARDAVASVTRSAGEWVKNIETLIADGQKQTKDTVERIGGNVLKRAEWLEKLKANVAQGNDPAAPVRQASQIVDELESNIEKVTEAGTALQRLLQKKLKAMPPAMQRERAVKPLVDEARLLYGRLDTVMNKVQTDGAKIVRDYQAFVAEHGG
jgi:hypothetical protein